MRLIRTLALTTVLLSAASATYVELHLKRAVSEAIIEREFQARSTPGTPKYQQHLSMEELRQLVRPQAGAAEAVDAFIAHTPGVTAQGRFVSHDVVKIDVTPGTAAAELLSVDAGGAVPAPLAAHVERVVLERKPKGLRHYQGGRRSSNKPDIDWSTSSISEYFAGMVQNPRTIAERYNVPMTPLTTPVVNGVGEFSPMGFSPESLNAFAKHYGFPTPVDIRVHGYQQSQTSGGGSWGANEGQLDVEYIIALAPNATTWWISVPNVQGSWAAWADAVMSLEPLPAVVSISWGENLAGFVDYTQVSSTEPIPPPGAAFIAAEDAFRKLGLLGVTAIASSGDDGASTWDSCKRFGPAYPAASQYVTAVGATYANATGEPEASVSWSGGGFSWWTKRPVWQEAAVNAYLQANVSGMPPTSMYNTTGRAYPDVAALGTNFAVAYNQSEFTTVNWSSTAWATAWAPMAGTSASAPTFASVITRVVAERLAKGKGTLGFLNPTLYQLGKVGQDVTIGRSGNNCPFTPTESTSTTFDDAAAEEVAQPQDQYPPATGFGFPTAPGWDAATGLGTPDYAYLVAQLA